MSLKIDEVKRDFRNDLSQVADLSGLNEVRIKYLGRKGLISNLIKDIQDIRSEERPEFGRIVNQMKKEAEELIDGRESELKTQTVKLRERQQILDITLPGRDFSPGRKHPVTRVLESVTDIFVSLGFQIEDGPEVETDYYNFEALNMPPNHPARDMWSTFYISDKGLLRTHTSPVQIRTMERYKPPMAIIAPGKCYRRDAIDASHSSVFHQVEGFLVDERVSFADLRGVLTYFVRTIFGKECKVRFRPSFFPFTEPSAEVDILCTSCKGKGCSVCGNKGWLEILGAGMIHPAVFKFVNYDPIRYRGFAFGMGIERITMLLHGIDDMRLFFENDLRFLEQF